MVTLLADMAGMVFESPTCRRLIAESFSQNHGDSRLVGDLERLVADLERLIAESWAVSDLLESRLKNHARPLIEYGIL